jgi:hypothetical protein
MSTHEAPTLLETQLDELDHAIAGGDLLKLKDVVNEQSQSRSRDDVFADALFISCDQGYHEAARYLLAKESANADPTSNNDYLERAMPRLVLAVRHCEAPFRQESLQNAGVGRTGSATTLKPTKFSNFIDGLI